MMETHPKRSLNLLKLKKNKFKKIIQKLNLLKLKKNKFKKIIQKLN